MADERIAAQPAPCADRRAELYDELDGWLERRLLRRLRYRIWELVPPGRILEVGVGTGANLRHYPAESQVTAVDRSQHMLDCARQRATEQGLDLDMRVMDVQALDFPDATFDSVVATLVFCSVPDPVAGLREVRRVLKPGGKAYLLEHMRSDLWWLAQLSRGLDVVLAPFSEERFSRPTVDNMRAAGLRVETAQNLLGRGFVRLIVGSRA